MNRGIGCAGGAAQEVEALLERELPTAWHGFPTRFATTWDPVVRQRVEVASAGNFTASRVRIAPQRLVGAEPLELEDWLQLTGQAALEVTAGAVFHDGPGVLTAIRARLAQYPEDVRRYAIGADWRRTGQELPDVGRAGLRGLPELLAQEIVDPEVRALRPGLYAAPDPPASLRSAISAQG